MSKLQNKLYALWREEEGLTTVEYAIAGGLVGLAVVGAFFALGGTVGGIIESIDNCLKSNGSDCTPTPAG